MRTMTESWLPASQRSRRDRGAKRCRAAPTIGNTSGPAKGSEAANAAMSATAVADGKVVVRAVRITACSSGAAPMRQRRIVSKSMSASRTG